MGTRGHGVAQVEGPPHQGVHERRVMGRDFPPVNEDRSLFLSPDLAVEINGLKAAVLCGAGNGRPHYGEELVPCRLQDCIREIFEPHG